MSHSMIIDGQKINLHLANTASSGAKELFLLGRVFYASTPGEKNLIHKISVNNDDRFTLVNQIESAELWINDSIGAVGALMSDVCYEEIDRQTLKKLGYLIAGLSELQKLVKQTGEMIPAASKAPE